MKLDRWVTCAASFAILIGALAHASLRHRVDDLQNRINAIQAKPPGDTG